MNVQSQRNAKSKVLMMQTAASSTRTKRKSISPIPRCCRRTVAVARTWQQRRIFMLQYRWMVMMMMMMTNGGVSAFPNGAGACSGTDGSVGGPHVSASNISTGVLEDYQLEVSLGDQVLSTDAVYSVVVSRPYALTLHNSSVSGSQFKGFLFRLSRSDGGTTIDELQVSTVENEALLTQVEPACSSLELAGITHTDNSMKQSAVTIMTLPEDAVEAEVTFTLQVTAVVEMMAAEDRSSYFYSSYAFIPTPPSAADDTTNTAFPSTTSRRSQTSTTPQPTPLDTYGSLRPTATDTNGINNPVIPATTSQPTSFPTFHPTLQPTFYPTTALPTADPTVLIIDQQPPENLFPDDNNNNNKNNDKFRNKQQTTAQRQKLKRKVRKCNRRVKRMCSCGLVLQRVASYNCVDMVVKHYCQLPRSRKSRSKFVKAVTRKSFRFCNKLLQVYK